MSKIRVGGRVLATLLVVVVILGLLGALLIRFSPSGVNSESNNTQVIQAVERQEQVVLLSTSTQGLWEENASRSIFGRNLPGSDRTQFLQYAYRAKLGIEGGEVDIKETGENEFRITVPEFIFIGHDNVEFKSPIEDGGVLRWATPEIDTTDAINEILDEDTMDGQIDANRDILQDQARAFYTGIIGGIDNNIELDFEFEGSNA